MWKWPDKAQIGSESNFNNARDIGLSDALSCPISISEVHFTVKSTGFIRSVCTSDYMEKTINLKQNAQVQRLRTNSIETSFTGLTRQRRWRRVFLNTVAIKPRLLKLQRHSPFTSSQIHIGLQDAVVKAVNYSLHHCTVRLQFGQFCIAFSPGSK